MAEDEVVEWYHRHNGHEPTPGDREGQGGLVCCSPWGGKESNMTQRLNNKYFISDIHHFYSWLEYKVEGLPSADIIQVTSQ